MTKRKHRRYSIPLKRMIVEAYFNGEALNVLSVEHDICRHLIRTWIDKYEKGEFDSEAAHAEVIPEYEARIAALERLVGRVFKNSADAQDLEDQRDLIHRYRSKGLSIRKGCELMGMTRSTFYAKSGPDKEDPAVAEIHDIVATFKGYGYRRVTAELYHRGMIVNSKKVRRIMRENGLDKVSRMNCPPKGAHSRFWGDYVR